MKYIKRFEKIVDKSEYLLTYLMYFIKAVAILDKPDLRKVEYLLKTGANPNIHDDMNNYGNMLTLAVYLDDIKLVKLMIKYGANLNDINSINVTPLYVAAHHGYFEIVKYLLKTGADINIANDNNISPLTTSTWGGYIDVAIYLLENGAELKGFDTYSVKKNYKFQKKFIELYPVEFFKYFKNDKIHDNIKKEFYYLFDANKFNI